MASISHRRKPYSVYVFVNNTHLLVTNKGQILILSQHGYLIGMFLDGWQRACTTRGVPYYINHITHRTQWSHPFLANVIEELDDLNGICYSAYRVALKVQFIQKKLSFEKIMIATINNAFERQGISDNTCVVKHDQLLEVLLDIFTFIQRGSPTRTSPEMHAEIALSWMTSLYDVEKTGGFKVSSVKVGLAALTAAKLFEKYEYFSNVCCDTYHRISRESLERFLDDIMQIVIAINESRPFGGYSVVPAANSCFKGSFSKEFLSKDVFLNWLVKDPQTILWLPTMHRLSAAELVMHDRKCAICKCYPIIGMRYRCLKCFNYDICQKCFLTGQTNGRHKNKHPSKEYCLNTTSREDTVDFLKTVKNIIIRKQKSRKLQYLPIAETGDISSHMQSTPKRGKYSQQEPKDSRNVLYPRYESNLWGELESIINHLEKENIHLLHQLEIMQISSQKSMDKQLKEDEDHRIATAKQEVLEEHVQQLETQIKRLRFLMKKGPKKEPGQQTSLKTLEDLKLKSQHLNEHPPKEIPRELETLLDLHVPNIYHELSSIPHENMSAVKRPSIAGVSDEDVEGHLFPVDMDLELNKFRAPVNYPYRPFQSLKSISEKYLEKDPSATKVTSSYPAAPRELTSSSPAGLDVIFDTLTPSGIGKQRPDQAKLQIDSILDHVTIPGEEEDIIDFEDTIQANLGNRAKSIGLAMSNLTGSYAPGNDDNVSFRLIESAQENNCYGNGSREDTSIWSSDLTFSSPTRSLRKRGNLETEFQS